MIEHPILFSDEMVRAILDGRKTQTRRVLRPQPPTLNDLYPVYNGYLGAWQWRVRGNWYQAHVKDSYCPYGTAGERLWVRETWFPLQAPNECWKEGSKPDVVYRADHPKEEVTRADWTSIGVTRWRPSIFMPRWASRITLEVTGVRLERVQSISVEDCMAEGVVDVRLAVETGYPSRWPNIPTRLAMFRGVWDSINGKRPGCAWADNPWVYVVEFKRV